MGKRKRPNVSDALTALFNTLGKAKRRKRKH